IRAVAQPCWRWAAMVMTMHRLSAGAGYQYLLKHTASGDCDRTSASPLTAYYTESGNPPGRWLGTGLAGVGGSGLVSGAMVAGFDLTFTPPKSVSTLWALADDGTQLAVLGAHRAAVDDALRFAERTALFTRTGHAGCRQIGTRGMLAAAFDHWDSRAGDPNLHTHVVIANKVQGHDGSWRSVDSKALHHAVVTISEVYDDLLADELARRLIGQQVVIDLRDRHHRVMQGLGVHRAPTAVVSLDLVGDHDVGVQVRVPGPGVPMVEGGGEHAASGDLATPRVPGPSEQSCAFDEPERIIYRCPMRPKDGERSPVIGQRPQGRHGLRWRARQVETGHRRRLGLGQLKTGDRLDRHRSRLGRHRRRQRRRPRRDALRRGDGRRVWPPEGRAGDRVLPRSEEVAHR